MIYKLPKVTIEGLKDERKIDLPSITGGEFITSGVELIDGDPRELVAIANETSVNLTWVNGSTNENGIIIERSLNGVNFAALNVVSNGENTYSDETAVSGTEYFYRVKAFKGHSYSAKSNVAGEILRRTPTNISLSASTIIENNAIAATIGTLSTTDADVGDTFVYSLVSGTGSTDNSSFTIDGAILKAGIVFDYETKTSYSIRVRTTDALGLYFEKAFTITVSNVAEAPLNVELVPDAAEIVINWTNNEASPTGTSIERSTDEISWAEIATTLGGIETYTDDDIDLQADVTYYYRLRTYIGVEYSEYTVSQGALLNLLKHIWSVESESRTAARNTSFTGTVRYVSPTGNDANSGLTVELAKKTITSACNASSNGAIIQMLDGTYDSADESGGYALFNTAGKGVLIQGNAADRTAVIINQSTAADYILRFRDCGEFRVQNLTLQSNQNSYLIFSDDGYNRYLKFDNCVINSTGTGSQAYCAYLANARTETFTKHFEFNNCSIQSTVAQQPIRPGVTGVNTTILITDCQITNAGSISLTIGDGNTGTIALYDNVFTQGSNHVIIIVGTDTTAPTNSITGLIDIRGNTIQYAATFYQHAVLLGRGTNKVILQNNYIFIPETSDVSAIALAIKTISTNVGDSVIEGNYVKALRPCLIKGASKLTIRYNTFIANHANGYGLEMSNAKEADAVDLNCNTNTITNNNIVGIAGKIIFASTPTAESTKDSALTCTINSNKYYSLIDIYINNVGTMVTWAELSTFWDVNTNDNLSTLIPLAKLPIELP